MIFSEMMIKLVNPALLILLVLLVYMGYRKGFLSKLLSCFSFLVIVFLSWQLAGPFSKVFKILPAGFAPYQNTPLADFFYLYANQIFLFVILVVIASLAIFLLKPILLMFGNLPVISSANALLGAAFGVVEMLLMCFVLLFVLHTPMIKNGSQVIQSTFFSKIEILQSQVFTIGSGLLKDFDLMSNIQNLDAAELKQFLSEHGYSDEEIQKFIRELGKSYE